MNASKRKLTSHATAVFLRGHPGWKLERNALVRTFTFGRYGAGLTFATRVGRGGDAQDHHPDITIGYQRVRVAWSTHDAGGVTMLDAEMANMTDIIYQAKRGA